MIEARNFKSDTQIDYGLYQPTDYLWPPYVIGGVLYFCPVISSFYLLLSSFFPRLIAAVQIGRLPYFDTWCGPNANLECRSETSCMRLAGNAGRKKLPSRHHRTTSLVSIFTTNARINNRKKLLNSNISPTCPHNMVNLAQ